MRSPSRRRWSPSRRCVARQEFALCGRAPLSYRRPSAEPKLRSGNVLVATALSFVVNMAFVTVFPDSPGHHAAHGRCVCAAPFEIARGQVATLGVGVG